MQLKFVLREAFKGLGRNLTMTIALIITTAISVALVVAGVLVSNMARETQDIYLERVEVMIQLDEEISNSDQDCSTEGCLEVKEILEADDGVERLTRAHAEAGLVAAARIPAVDASMAATEDRIRSNWARTFSPEIERSTDAGLLDAIDTVLAWSTIFHLLERRHLPESACTAICTRMLTALVQAPGGRR